jgi:hypothetical protein
MKVMSECDEVYATDNCVNRDYCAQWLSLDTVEKIIDLIIDFLNLMVFFAPFFIPCMLRHSSPRRLAGEKNSCSYNHKRTFWVSH